LSISNDGRPRLVRLPESYRVGVARFAVTAQRFVGHLGDMRPPHHHRNPRRPHGVRHLVSLSDHAGHGANPYQADVILPDVLDELLLAHPPRVAVEEKHLVAGGRERFQEEHPKMRHEIIGDFVVRIVEKNIHWLFASVYGVTGWGGSRKPSSPAIAHAVFGLAIPPLG